MAKFVPRVISDEMKARGYNNEGRGDLLGYIAVPSEHEEKCPYRKDQKNSCACRIGLWQDKTKPKTKAKAKRKTKKKARKK